jgi:hypothetical protein
MKNKEEWSSYDYTNECWSEALKITKMERVNRDTKKWANNYHKVDAEYMRLIKKLPTHVLELLIKDYHSDKVTRARSTIQEVLDELAKRILLEEVHEI